MVKYAFGFPVHAMVSHIPVKSRMAVNYVIAPTHDAAHPSLSGIRLLQTRIPSGASPIPSAYPKRFVRTITELAARMLNMPGSI